MKKRKHPNTARFQLRCNNCGLYGPCMDCLEEMLKTEEAAMRQEKKK